MLLDNPETSEKISHSADFIAVAVYEIIKDRKNHVGNIFLSGRCKESHTLIETRREVDANLHTAPISFRL
ncbi:MAG: hypothetical protein IJF90_04855 [Synergistaceae bacterium]|nr:hypothetical protein [Synergistaceae bacterium]